MCMKSYLHTASLIYSQIEVAYFSAMGDKKKEESSQFTTAQMEISRNKTHMTLVKIKSNSCYTIKCIIVIDTCISWMVALKIFIGGMSVRLLYSQDHNIQKKCFKRDT